MPIGILTLREVSPMVLTPQDIEKAITALTLDQDAKASELNDMLDLVKLNQDKLLEVEARLDSVLEDLKDKTAELRAMTKRLQLMALMQAHNK